MNSDEQVKDIFRFDPDRVQSYKVVLRRNRLFGFWAGEQLGMLSCEMLDYIASVVHADLEEPGDLDILRKVHGDLLAFGKMISEADLRAKLAEVQEQARHEMGALSHRQDIEFQVELACPPPYHPASVSLLRCPQDSKITSTSFKCPYGRLEG